MDAGSLLCAGLIAHASQPGALRPWMLVLAAAGILLGLAASGLYTGRPRVGGEARQVVIVSALTSLALAGGELAWGAGAGAGDAAVRFGLLAATLMVAGRLALHGGEHVSRRANPHEGGATLIVGAGHIGHLAAQRLQDEPQLGLRPIGFLDKDPLRTVVPADPGRRLPVLGASYDLEEVVAERDVEHVLIAFSTAPSHVVLDLVRRCWKLGVSVMVVPRLFEVEGRRTRTDHLGALPVVTLQPSDPRSWQFTCKYALDRVVAAVTLLVLSPLLAGIALAIVATSGRPVFFRQRRVGRDGQVFDMLKFRTMSGEPSAAGEHDAHWAAMALGGAGDGGGIAPASVSVDRRTAVGTVLRQLSLDEVPQLWNVLRGDMSLIGPRPERDHYVQRFADVIYRYPERHRVKSGLTGWAQVHGLRGETSLSDRIEWDNFYIENWSLWLDLKILVKTIPALLRGHGAG